MRKIIDWPEGNFYQDHFLRLFNRSSITLSSFFSLILMMFQLGFQETVNIGQINKKKKPVNLQDHTLNFRTKFEGHGFLARYSPYRSRTTEAWAFIT